MYSRVARPGVTPAMAYRATVYKAGRFTSASGLRMALPRLPMLLGIGFQRRSLHYNTLPSKIEALDFHQLATGDTAVTTQYMVIIK